MSVPKSAKKNFVSMDRATEAKLKKLTNEGDRLDREKKKLMARIKRLSPRTGDIERDQNFYARLHDLELQGLELEEKSIMAFLDATRLWKRMLQRQGAAARVPDAWAEMDRMLYKRERIRQIERDIQLEQFEFWAKTGWWATP